jgi:UDP-N-acetylglucosamine diphosphorylase / glucose-1-phosphate thymidylyltransferase / UDP-N-acetylgalactosamine diphosphorylase / glucosamine-1-phosphate N-acetyltransferase / galactosamine-1-phosphate N-acetyltransferase
MKALILAGGRGKRLGSLTESTNKCLLNIGGKPAIEYNLERAIDIEDVNEIIIVVGHKAEDIINRYGTEYKGKKIRYVLQSEQRGLVHAIECSKDAIGNDDFFLFLGDEVMSNSRHKEMMKKFKEENLFAVCGITNQEDKTKIGRTYAVIVDNNDRIFRLIEKPKKALNNYQGTGHCIFKNEVLSFIDRTPIHPERGERELPDLIQCTIDDGQSVKIFNICDNYTNINSEEDLKEAESMTKN